MEFAIGLLVGIMVMHLASKIMMWWAMRSMERDLGMSMEEIVSQVMSKSQSADHQEMQDIDAEYAEGEIFFYDAQTSVFLAKGRTFEEVMQRYHERFGEQKIRVRVPDTDTALIGLIPRHHME